MTNIDNSVMDWNDVIEDDGQEFVLLPEGDYNFVVTNFERGRFPGSAKIPATNKATKSIQIFLKWVLPRWNLTWFFKSSYLEIICILPFNLSKESGENYYGLE